MTTVNEITIEQFDKEYLPQTNQFNDNVSWDGCMFETYGQEYDYVKSIFNINPDRIWTIVEDDDGDPVLTNGFHCVNRIGYVVTVYPAPKDTLINVVDN
jgi:hypothetical protein